MSNAIAALCASALSHSIEPQQPCDINLELFVNQCASGNPIHNPFRNNKNMFLYKRHSFSSKAFTFPMYGATTMGCLNQLQNNHETK